MSIKNLFEINKNIKVISSSSNEDLKTEIESSDLLEQKIKQNETFVPEVDFSDPKNFAKYGSAKKYYEDAFTRIKDQYPYDGSLKEKIEFFNTSTYLGNWIYNNKYPRTTGFVTISPNGWGSRVGSIVNGYGLPSTLNYISLKGGPNSGSGTNLKEIFETSNKYSTEYSVKSNLQLDLHTGVTVEFWLKKDGFDLTKTNKEVIFDSWNNESSSSNSYGRLTIQLSASSNTADQVFNIIAQSGSNGINTSIGTITRQEITSSGWNHYAFVLSNTSSNIQAKLYVNGNLDDTVTTGTSISEVTGAFLASLGSLRTAASGSPTTAIGWGKLSGSLDEFRYWKNARTDKQISRFWFTNVNGGTNTDTANINLGVYYKFNEGLTYTSSIDSKILDYSGRVSNGVFVGYVEQCRSTGSAIVLASAADTEQPDPILYAENPLYQTELSNLLLSASNHDETNNAQLYTFIPQWIRDEEENIGEGLLPNLVQTLSTYFDSLHLQVEQVNKFKNIEYPVEGRKPNIYNNRLLESVGFIAPEIFADVNILEQILNRSETKEFSESLIDIKNIIYRNIYNNLHAILKSKGTEKSFRNLIRCFGIDTELIKLNLYANNSTYTLKDNRYAAAIKKKFVDFNDPDRFECTVYQHTSSTGELTYIPGNVSSSYTGMTVEAEVLFPKTFSKSDSAFFSYPLLSSSLFGMHRANSSSNTNYTWYSTDLNNFQVYAVRSEKDSKHAYFQLRNTNLSINITSSYYYDLYDNNKWNFAVRIKPDKFENVDLASGSTPTSYSVEFYGVQTIYDSVKNEFLLTASINSVTGSAFTENAKRFYVGSHVTNFTSSANVLTYSDVKISSLKYWNSYLEDEEIIAHSKDIDNYGLLHPYKNAFLTQTDTDNLYIPKIETLALNWNFNKVSSSSDSSDLLPTTKDAKFTVYDISYDTNSSTTTYSWLSNITKRNYSGQGDFFLPNDIEVVNNEYVSCAKQQLPEVLNTEDTINILSQDDETFTRDTTTINNFFVFEKSMYQTISEEIINMFGTIVDFNNLIGEPVNRYRQEYKDLSKLKQLFFNKLGNTPELDKYIDFYQWFDTSLSLMLAELIPASANISENIRTLVENHILERNKYWNKFPSMEFKGTDPETGMQSVNKLLYNWRVGHAPLNNSEDSNCLWWSNRSERNTDRQKVFDAKTQVINRSYTTPYKFSIEQSKTLRGGINFEINKNIDFNAIATQPHGPLDTDDIINVPANYLFIGIENTSSVGAGCTDILDPNKKTKYYFKTIHGRDYLSSSLNYNQVIDSKFALPFNIISGTVSEGYQKSVVDNFLQNVIITNVHNDVYGKDKETPIQGPFTNRWVGGRQSRHVSINTGADDYTTRPEAWKILLGTGSTTGSYETAIGVVGADYPYPEGNPFSPGYPVVAHKRATYFREETAKRPINIKNIQSTTSSIDLGNYSKTYEVIHTFGATSNNRTLLDIANPSNQTELAGIVRTDITDGRLDYELPTRTENKSVIINRFSAPGDYRTRSRGYLNNYAEELSVYNAYPFRNKQIIGDGSRNSENLATDTTQYPSIVSGSKKDLNSLLSNKTDFGGYASGSTTIASFHKTNRNPISSSDGIDNDNGFVTHQIPQKDSGYSWIKNAATGTYSDNGHIVESFTVPSSSTSTTQSLVIISASLFGLNNSNQLGVESPVLPVDFVGLNNIIVDSINTSSDNTLGLSSFITSSIVSSFVGIGSSSLLNSLLLNRNGGYGYTSFNQIRNNNGKIVRYNRKNNIFSIVQNKRKFNNINPSLSSIINKSSNISYSINNYSESPIKINYPSTVKGGITTNVNVGDLAQPPTNVSIKFTLENEINYFSNNEINKKLSLNNCDSQAYKRISKTYLNGGLESEQSPFERFDSLTYKNTLYPSSTNIFLSINTRPTFIYKSWLDSYAERIDNTATGFDSIQIQSQSIWPLDAVKNFDTRVSYVNSIANSNGGGILQRNNGDLIFQDYNSSYTSPLLAKRHTLFSTSSLASYTGIEVDTSTETGLIFGSASIYFGDAKWQANEQAVEYDNNIEVSSSRNPFYNSYDDYSSDLKFIGKEYTVVPEFRISDQIEFYLNDKDYLKQNINLFSVTGGLSAAASSSQTNFYKVYSTSELLKNFDILVNDHSDIAEPTSITLTCNAISKFIPYEGFYPVERTTQIINAFSASYYKDILIDGTTIVSWPTVPAKHLSIKPIMDVMFSPGLLYNTIKSGISIDYPVINLNANSSNELLNIGSGSAGEFGANNVDGNWRIGKITKSGSTSPYFDLRIPFETLLKPEDYIKNVKLFDNNPHPSASIGMSGSFVSRKYAILQGDGTNEKYKLMINNFVSEIPKFFLQNEELSSLKSKTDSALNLNLVSGSVYGARVRLYRSLNKGRSFGLLPYELPQDPDAYYDYEFSGSNAGLRETYTLYSRPTAFGPSVASILTSSESGSIISTVKSGSTYLWPARESINGWNPAYTPPYYNGESWADIVFKAKETKKYSLKEIISNSTINYLRIDDRSSSLDNAGVEKNLWGGRTDTLYGRGNANVNSMQLSASLYLDAYSATPTIEYDKNNKISVVRYDTDNSFWNIKTKFETPMLNFNEVSKSLPNVLGGASSVPNGIWHQFGKIPQNDEGVFLQIGNIPSNWLQYHPNATSSLYYQASSSIKSLSDLVGFSKEPVKLGKVSSNRRVYEAIVAVPFIEKNGRRKFFEIPQQVIDTALERNVISLKDGSDVPGNTILEMVNKMKKYVLPPTFDFINNEGVTPVSMYIFEFYQDFDQNDLSYIWQNLSPKSGVKAVKSNSTISHKLLFNELMGHENSSKNKTYDTNVQWMIFKAKQKANVDYYEDLHSDILKIDDVSFKPLTDSTKPKYSYNWPYDYFSIVELVNLGCEITISNFDEEDTKVKVPSPKITTSNIGSPLKTADLSINNTLTKLNNSNIEQYKTTKSNNDSLTSTLSKTVTRLTKK
jgi:hypothetical protein